MIGSSNNSGGVVVGAVVCGTECTGFKIRLRFFSFSLVESSGCRLDFIVRRPLPPPILRVGVGKGRRGV